MSLRTCFVLLAIVAFAAALPAPSTDETLDSEESTWGRHGWGGGYGPHGYGGFGPGYGYGGYGGYGSYGGYGGYGRYGGYGGYGVPIGIGIGFGNIW